LKDTIVNCLVPVLAST